MFERWQDEGVLVRDGEPALWALEQEYTGPDGRGRTRRGFFARVRVEDYGPGRIRPHERTHPGPKEDRLRLTRATNANLSPIFSLYDDPAGAACAALDAAKGEPWAEVTDDDGTAHRLWRVADPEAARSGAGGAARQAELLIADGHHRYETARVHHAEGGAGHVLMCLVALQDPGLTVFPTHRLLTRARRRPPRGPARRRSSATSSSTPIAEDELEPAAHGRARCRSATSTPTTGGRCCSRCGTRRSPRAALPGKPEPYRALDTAVLEALILKRRAGMTEDDISHLHGLDYARDTAQARAARRDRRRGGRVLHAAPRRSTAVRDVAAAGESMPPKSTYFFPKVLTGMVFNPLD